MAILFVVSLLSLAGCIVFTFFLYKRNKNLSTKLMTLESTFKKDQLRLKGLESQKESYEKLRLVIKESESNLDSGSDIVNTVTDSIGKLTNDAKVCMGNMSGIYASIRDSSSALKQAKKPFEDLGGILFELNELGKEITELKENMKEVEEKSKSITDISFQAKLLSFNASVEAARAGDLGKGFAVVAEEVGNLANMSDKASKDVIQIITKNSEGLDKISSTLVSKISDAIRVEEQIQDVFGNIEKSSRVMGVEAEKNSKISNTFEENMNQTAQNTKSHLESLLSNIAQVMSTLDGSTIVDISVKDVREKKDLFDKIIDVRKADEYHGPLGHIENSVLWTLQDNIENKIRTLDQNKQYLFVCRSGGRSAKACKIAQDLGVKNVFNLEGGMLAWSEYQSNIRKAS